MTPLEIRIILYAVGALVFGGSIAWASVTLTNHHWERVTAAEKLAQDEALAEAQRTVIAAQKAQKDAETKVETEHEARTQADTVSRGAVLDSVRGLQSAVSRWRLSSAVDHPGAVQTTQPGAAGDSGLSELVGRFNASLDRLIERCQTTDSDRTAILSLEPKVKP